MPTATTWRVPGALGLAAFAGEPGAAAAWTTLTGPRTRARAKARAIFLRVTEPNVFTELPFAVAADRPGVAPREAHCPAVSPSRSPHTPNCGSRARGDTKW